MARGTEAGVNAGGGDACRGAEQNKEEGGKGWLTGGPGGDFHFLFIFFPGL